MCTKWPKREKQDFMKFQAPGRGGYAAKLFFYKNTFFEKGGGKNLEYLKN